MHYNRIIAQLQRYQRLPYNFQVVKPLHKALTSLEAKTDENQLYARSLEVEPRQG